MARRGRLLQVACPVGVTMLVLAGGAIALADHPPVVTVDGVDVVLTGDTEVVEGTGFTSRSGNIGCYIDPETVQCDIGERDWAPPPKPADCPDFTDFGQDLTPEEVDPLDSSAPATPRSTADRPWRSATPSPPGACAAKAPLQASDAGTLRTAAHSRFHASDTRCPDLAGSHDSPRGGDLCADACVDYRRASRWATISSVARGCSAVGSASPCQGEGRGFESRHPLEVQSHQPQRWSGRVVRQRPAKPCTRVRFPSPPPAGSRRD